MTHPPVAVFHAGLKTSGSACWIVFRHPPFSSEAKKRRLEDTRYESSTMRASLLRASAAVPLIAYFSSACAAELSWTAKVNSRARADDGADLSDAAKVAIEAMNKGYYNTTDGRWDSIDAWWLTGVAFQTVIDYMLLTGTKDYLDQVKHTFELQKEPVEWWPEGGGYFRADSTDDTGWWALAMVSLYDLTNSTEYLDVARLDEEYMYDYWNSSTCGGGLIWDIPSLEYKNAISNEQYVRLTAALHNRIPGDEKYLKKALDSWEWFRDSGMINTDNLVNDGLAEGGNGTCSNNGQTTWTYNQGVILGGLTELYRATNDEEYLDKAKEIADAAVASEYLNPDGILTEPCDADEGCTNDQAVFKGIFAKYLAELNGVLDGEPYSDYLNKNIESAWQNARNETDFFAVSWTGPFDKFTIGSQASAASLLLLAL